MNTNDDRNIGAEDIVFGETRHAKRHVARIQLRPGHRVRVKSGVFAGCSGRVIDFQPFGLVRVSLRADLPALSVLEADLEPMVEVEA